MSAPVPASAAPTVTNPGPHTLRVWVKSSGGQNADCAQWDSRRLPEWPPASTNDALVVDDSDHPGGLWPLPDSKPSTPMATSNARTLRLDMAYRVETFQTLTSLPNGGVRGLAQLRRRRAAGYPAGYRRQHLGADQRLRHCLRWTVHDRSGLRRAGR